MPLRISKSAYFAFAAPAIKSTILGRVQRHVITDCVIVMTTVALYSYDGGFQFTSPIKNCITCFELAHLRSPKAAFPRAAPTRRTGCGLVFGDAFQGSGILCSRGWAGAIPNSQSPI